MSAAEPEPTLAEPEAAADEPMDDEPAAEEPAADEVVPADLMPFADLCALLERLHKKKKDRLEQDRILTSFFDEFRLNAAQIPGKKNCSLFPIMRLLLPECDRERGAYNLKETKLGALLARVLALAPGSEDARRLAEYRGAPQAGDSDFAGVAYFVLKGRLAHVRGTLTVRDVNQVLDKIAGAQVGAKGPVLEEAFGSVLRQLSAEQLKWFLRAVLKDLRLGMRARRVLAALHPDAPETYHHCSSLLKTCCELEGGGTRPLELGVRVFSAVSPMRCERLDVRRSPALPSAQYAIETKFDGERFQIHMQDGVFEYFSRKGHSYGQHYGRGGGEGEGGLLTPRLRGGLARDVTSVILDGEMMGWHKLNHTLGTKGMSFDVKKLTGRSSYQPCFVAFDVLFHNGRALAGGAGVPLRERRALLERVVTEVPGALLLSQCRHVRDNAEILEALNRAIENAEEGVVVKDLDSLYLANRSNAGWYKVKPEYTEGAMVDMDLVVIGAEEAADKRHGGARSFHVACADSAEPGEEPSRWLCVGRVATGLSHEQRARLCGALERHWTRRSEAPPPACLVFNREKPDWWLLPEHSVVLQVRATELIRSTDFGTSHTLRFPRVEAVRDDKPTSDVMTRAQFDALVAGGKAVVKLSAGRLEPGAGAEAGAGAGAGRRKRSARVLEVPRQFRAKTDDGNVQAVSGALAGRELCVVSDDEDCRRPELVRIIQAHGGKHVENIGSMTWCAVAGRRTFRVSSLVSAGSVDVVSTAWLRALPASAAPAVLSPLDMLAVSGGTRLALCRLYDRAGDSYTHPTDERTLQRCFDKLDEEPAVHLTTRETLELERELFGSASPFSFLRGCVLLLRSPSPRAHAHAHVSAAARMRGARLSTDAADPALTHVVLPAGSRGDAGAWAMRPSVLVVSDAWLDACLRQESRVLETPYLIDCATDDNRSM